MNLKHGEAVEEAIRAASHQRQCVDMGDIAAPLD
jgi:hypothetical protein